MNLYILPNEIFFTIFDYLDIDSIKETRLVGTLISMLATDHLRQKYYYIHDKITDNEIKNKIRCLSANSINAIQEYPYIRKLFLNCNQPLQPGILPDAGGVLVPKGWDNRNETFLCQPDARGWARSGRERNDPFLFSYRSTKERFVSIVLPLLRLFSILIISTL